VLDKRAAHLRLAIGAFVGSIVAALFCAGVASTTEEQAQPQRVLEHIGGAPGSRPVQPTQDSSSSAKPGTSKSSSSASSVASKSQSAVTTTTTTTTTTKTTTTTTTTRQPPRTTTTTRCNWIFC
jgi:cytoskeletal protein RodZ